jgi:glucose-6-phosphate dehydrogenase assembly protein OpcA
MSAMPKQIHVKETLNVQAIEQTLADLWKQTASHPEDTGDEAVLRARAADLMIFLNNESLLAETQQLVSELASFHPCRALLMVGSKNEPARDIEVYVSTFCSLQPRADSRYLCCEAITLTARGSFVSELPSAALPLLVPDLPVFLWWRELPGAQDKIFSQLCLTADRVVIDSGEFHDIHSGFAAVSGLFGRTDEEAVLLTDLNWARLTPWRAALANFYDVADYRTQLDHITDVCISSVSDTTNESGMSSQALLILAWLASRLQWNFAAVTPTQPPDLGFRFDRSDRAIQVTLKHAQRPGMKPGRLFQVELKCDSQAMFVVSRSEDGLHLATHSAVGEQAYPGQLVPVGNWSEAEMLSREMEILCNDKIYEDAVAGVTEIIAHVLKDPQPPDTQPR